METRDKSQQMSAFNKLTANIILKSFHKKATHTLIICRKLTKNPGDKSEGLCNGYIQVHKYIHNCSLQPFSRDFHLAYHTTYVVCVECYTYISGGTHSF